MLSTTDRMPHDRMDRADDSDPSMPKEWGPLAGLADEWEGEGGLDTAFSHPFHTEVGYWLWDAADGQVMRCFMVPRGSVVLAGGTSAADATAFELRADCGSEVYGILSNPYLARGARSASYQATIAVDGDVFSYEQDTTIEHARWHEPVHHTDRNRLQRVAPSTS